LVYTQRYYIAFKDSLAKFPSPQKLAKAIEEMLPKLQQQLVAIPEKKTEEVKITVKTPAHTLVNTSENKIIQQLDEEIKMLYAKLGSILKPKLHFSTGEKQAYELQKQMVKVDDQLFELLEKKNYVLEHGMLPPVAKEEKKAHSLQAGTVEAAMRFVNLQKYVTRYQGYINKGNRELIKIEDQKQRDNQLKQIEQWEMKLHNYKVELAEVSKMMKQ
jgi:hypothetical protein